LTFDRLIKRVFNKSSRLSNIALTCSFASFLFMIALLAVFQRTGAKWASYTGVASFFSAIVFCAVALGAQNVSQAIRVVSQVRMKIRENQGNPEDPPSFKEDDPLYAKLIKKAFRVTAAKGADFLKPLKMVLLTPSRSLRVTVHARNNARSYRRALRPAFAHASSDGGGGNGDSSGESDSGDPPGPSHHTPLQLSQTFYRKLNSFSLRPRRFSRRPGCWRMFRCKCAVRRWAA
jgi:hypothetical protein